MKFGNEFVSIFEKLRKEYPTLVFTSKNFINLVDDNAMYIYYIGQEYKLGKRLVEVWLHENYIDYVCQRELIDNLNLFKNNIKEENQKRVTLRINYDTPNQIEDFLVPLLDKALNNIDW